jgi:hypothetical protein
LLTRSCRQFEASAYSLVANIGNTKPGARKLTEEEKFGLMWFMEAGVNDQLNRALRRNQVSCHGILPKENFSLRHHKRRSKLNLFNKGQSKEES